MKKKVLIVLVGPPGSGKSTHASVLAHALYAPIISPDAIRLTMHGERFNAGLEAAVWWVAELTVASLFRAGHQYVVLDATNVTKSRRARWCGSSIWRTDFVLCDVPLDTCKARVRQRDHNEDLVPIIDKMFADFEPVDLAEGEVRLRLTEEELPAWELVDLAEAIWLSRSEV